MSARVIPLEDPAGVRAALEQLVADVDEGRVTAVAIVTADPVGGLEVWWGASRRLGRHAGTLLRGMAAYLGAQMDAAALEP